MTQDEIIRMAREAGIDAESDTLCSYEGWVEPLERFAALVASAERERICQLLGVLPITNSDLKLIRDVIRARNNK